MIKRNVMSEYQLKILTILTIFRGIFPIKKQWYFIKTLSDVRLFQVQKADVRFFLEIQTAFIYTIFMSLTLNGERLAVMFGASFSE